MRIESVAFLSIVTLCVACSGGDDSSNAELENNESSVVTNIETGGSAISDSPSADLSRDGALGTGGESAGSEGDSGGSPTKLDVLTNAGGFSQATGGDSMMIDASSGGNENNTGGAVSDGGAGNDESNAGGSFPSGGDSATGVPIASCFYEVLVGEPEHFCWEFEGPDPVSDGNSHCFVDSGFTATPRVLVEEPCSRVTATAICEDHQENGSVVRTVLHDPDPAFLGKREEICENSGNIWTVL